MNAFQALCGMLHPLCGLLQSECMLHMRYVGCHVLYVGYCTSVRAVTSEEMEIKQGMKTLCSVVAIAPFQTFRACVLR